MTENEAIKTLKIMFANNSIGMENKQEVLEAAIQALEEIQEYRAIGTVEELKKIEESFNVTSDKVWNHILAGEELLKRYEVIGTVEEFKALKEKNVAKKPMPIDYEKYIGVIENAKFLRGAYWCPNCKHTVRSGAYCDDCGQKLDWQ